jgi:hypothetical protein
MTVFRDTLGYVPPKQAMFEFSAVGTFIASVCGLTLVPALAAGIAGGVALYWVLRAVVSLHKG